MKEFTMSEITAPESHHVVIYARTAAGGQSALDAQVTQLRTAAVRNGWAEANVLTERRGHSISDQALAAVLGGDVVLIRDLTRLSRDVGRLIEIRRSLISRRVVVAMPDRVESPDMARRHLGMMMLLRRMP